MKCPETVVMASSDVAEYNLKTFRDVAQGLNNGKFGSPPKVKAYRDFRDLLARTDIDAVVIATPDHWHAYMVVEAVKTGKDIYCEKPLASTVMEGRAMITATRK